MLKSKLVAALTSVALAYIPYVVVTESAVLAQAGTGGLRGVVKNKKTGEGVAGATIVATSPALVGEQIAMSDENGGYFVTSLPPGMYTLTIYYNDAQFTRSNVLIQVGKESFVNIPVEDAVAAGEVIKIEEKFVPVVDQGSSKISNTLTKDYTRNVPTGRTFAAVLGTAAGTQGDAYGTSFSGATSVENVYVVEGINTTNTATGEQSANLPSEFVQEIEVISGGYNAEYGRATGGVINVVTKSGSDEFHGTLFGAYRPGALSPRALRINNAASSIATEGNLDYRLDSGFEVGGPIIKKKLWFHVGANPTLSRSKQTRIISSYVDENGDGVRDTDENGLQIGNEISRRNYSSNAQTYFFTGKVNGAIGANHQYQISAFGNPANSKGPLGFTRDPNAGNTTNQSRVYDVSAKWTSKLNDGKTQIDIVAGHHRDTSTPLLGSASQDATSITYDYERSLYDFVDLEGATSLAGCQDGGPDDKYAKIDNCPVTGYTDRGVGGLARERNTRNTVVASLTQRAKFLGTHIFKFGGDMELSSYDSFNRRPGGVSLVAEADAAEEGIVFTGTQYLAYDANGQAVPVDSYSADTKNRSIGAYAQDSWQLRPNLTANFGLRWEQQTAFVSEHLQGKTNPTTGETIPEEAFKLDNMWAPRIGLIWDPSNEGRSKVFANWGRYYQNVPMKINVRAFGGEYSRQSIYNADEAGVANDSCAFDRNNPNVVQDTLNCSAGVVNTNGGTVNYWAPGTKAQFSEDLMFGLEHQLTSGFKVGATFTRRSLPTVIEDMSIDNAHSYFIGNPGADYSAEAAKLEQQAETLMATDEKLAGIYKQRASWLKATSRFDSPSRDYNAVTLTASQRPTNASLLTANYTYSRVKGNYPGLYSVETGQLDPNLTSMFDLPDLMPNRYGAGGLDTPHLLKVDGFYRFPTQRFGIFTFGSSFRAQSGRPLNTLAAHPLYGQGESYLLPRGSQLRGNATMSVDGQIQYGYAFSKDVRLELFGNVFNIFNQQTETNFSSRYTLNASLPIVGGDPSDLAHAKRMSAAGSTDTVVTPFKNYGNVTARQAPTAFEFGARFIF